MTLPPGPRGLPLVGDIKMFNEDYRYILGLIKQYGSIFSVDFGPQRLIYLIGARYMQYVLADNVSNFLNGPVGDLMGGPIYGDGVLFLDGGPHKQARRMMQPAFHKKRVDSYLTTMVDEIQHELENWPRELDINTVMHQLTLNIVTRVLFNLNVRSEVETLSHAWHDVMSHNGDMFGVILSRIPFSNRRQGTDVVNKLIYRLLAERRANPSDAGDILSMLLDARDEDGSVFSDQQIRDHLFILLLAGHETSANGLTWMFYLLTQHPEWARRLWDEINTILGNRAPTTADFDQMPVLDMVVKESLRLLPPVPGFLREIAQDCELDGYRLPHGSLVYYSILGTHLQPDLYPEPNRWKPERFAANAPRQYNAYEYLPFGAASRLCLGMPMAILEMKAILVMVMQKYRLVLVPDQTVTVVFRGTLTPREGIRMQLVPQDGNFERSPAIIKGSITEHVHIGTIRTEPQTTTA